MNNDLKIKDRADEVLSACSKTTGSAGFTHNWHPSTNHKVIKRIFGLPR